MSSTTAYIASVELQETSRQDPPHLSRSSHVSPHPSQIEISNDSRGIRRQLAPVDGGAAAWRLLCAAFVFEALFWGKAFPKTIGARQLLRQGIKGFHFP